MAKLAGTTFSEIARLLGDRYQIKIGNNTTAENDNGDIVVRLHGHKIVTLTAEGDIAFTLAGYPTVTTKERVNQFLPAGRRVFHKNNRLFFDDREISSNDEILILA